jgi:hypothetical protein
MKQFTTILSLILLAGVLYAQQSDAPKWEFLKQLEVEADKVYRKSSYESIDVDSLDRAFFATEKVKMQIDTTASWKILFQYSFSRSHTIGSDGIIKTLYPPEFQRRERNNVRTAYPKAKIFSGADLYKGLSLNDAYTIPLDSIIEYFPIIFFRRDHPLNKVWHPLMNDEYLILRFVNSYPHGNTTSAYAESRIYFKRIDH